MLNIFDVSSQDFQKLLANVNLPLAKMLFPAKVNLEKHHHNLYLT